MKSKRAVIGSFMATFIATIIIVILITMFIFFSGSVKSVSKNDAGESVFNEESLGLEDGVGYMENYIKLVDARSRYSDELSLDEALVEVKYDEK